MIQLLKNTALPLLIILTLGLVLQVNHLNEPPNGVHAWSQAQQHAISIGFVNNQLNFFAPEGFTYNKQFPDNWQTNTKTTRTSVDFPIHNYIPAILMSVSGSKSPAFQRVYIFLLSFIGLLFLYKIAFLLTQNKIKSTLVLILAATSPVFIYYQSNFLPSIPSLSCAITGVYFYIKHLNNNKLKTFVSALIFCTLAGLSRSSFSIVLLAILIYESRRAITHKTIPKHKLFPVFTVGFILVIYYFYNQYLMSKYGSMFLSSIKPPTSWQDVTDTLYHIFNQWIFEYFSWFHYLIFGAILILSIRYNKTSTSVSKPIIQFIYIYLICTLIYSVLIFRMFKDHDYHFLDTFYLPILLLSIYGLSKIPKQESFLFKYGSIALLVITSSITVAAGINTHKERRVILKHDRAAQISKNYAGAEEFLDSLKIPSTAKLLVIDGPYPSAPSLPFILMNRKGYTAMTYREILERKLQWDFDYIIFQNDLIYDDVNKVFPEFFGKLDFIASNNKISVCTLKNQHEVWKIKMDYDNYDLSSWQNVNTTARISYTGRNSGETTPDQEFGITYKTKNQPLLKTQSRVIKVSAKCLAKKLENTEVIIELKENGKQSYYKAYNIQSVLSNKNTWGAFEFEYQLPQVYSKDYELVVYVWNKAEDNFFLDDFIIKIF